MSGKREDCLFADIPSCETQWTFLAFIWPVTCMCPQVASYMLGSSERCRT